MAAGGGKAARGGGLGGSGLVHSTLLGMHDVEPNWHVCVPAGQAWHVALPTLLLKVSMAQGMHSEIPPPLSLAEAAKNDNKQQRQQTQVSFLLYAPEASCMHGLGQSIAAWLAQQRSMQWESMGVLVTSFSSAWEPYPS